MNRRRPHRQRGVVTLLGAVFLITVVATMLSAAQRMAGSGVIDSALHRDGVQALFLAESGLEHAAWRLADGAACTALSGESNDLGPGDFTIVSGISLGTECRVRVSGRVSFPGAAVPVDRVVEGDLATTVSGGGWAVGRRDGGGLLVEYDGDGWSRAGPSSGRPDRHLFDVSCVAADDCWAVGDGAGGGETLYHWDGTSWSRSGPHADIPDKKLFGVHCLDGANCWAVGEDRGGELILRWDGIRWRRVGPYADIPDVDLYSVHCTAVDECWAVGKDRGGELMIRWNGIDWRRAGPYAAIPNVTLNDVHCVSRVECWAVGERKAGALIVRWNGSTWRRSGTHASVADKDLESVHCSDRDDCWAVGTKDGHENINRWDGSTWTRIGNVPSIPSKDLHGVYMVSAAEGYVVGKSGTLAVWDGTAWTGHPPVTGKDLMAVTGYDLAGGGVELVRWREIVR